ncbi:ribonuclease H-like domain-containing protein [Tanacetum coccineum]
MHQPPGFSDLAHSDYVCLLQKSLYGLKKPPELVFSDFPAMLFESVSITAKLIRLFSSFTKGQTQLTYYYIWMISFLQLLLLHSYNMKYATEILERAQMINCNPCRTPVDIEKKLGPEGSPVTDPTLYRSLFGALQEPHLNAMKRVLRYLRGTTDLGLQLFRSTTSQLIAYSDADWAGYPATRQSTSGYYLLDRKFACSFDKQNFEVRYPLMKTLVTSRRPKDIQRRIELIQDRVITLLDVAATTFGVLSDVLAGMTAASRSSSARWGIEDVPARRYSVPKKSTEDVIDKGKS